MRNGTSVRSILIAGVSAIALGLPASAATYYWDTDGNTPGFGTTPRNGTWGTDAFWSTAAAGDVATVAWPNNTRTLA